MKLGIIGGSGLEDLNILEQQSEKEIETPYGNVIVKTGKLFEINIVIVSRHGKRHEIPPTYVNNRANIYALKKENVDYIIATTACGSLREEIKRGDLVILDQFIDFTKHRKTSFYDKFEQGPVHTSLAEPFSIFLRKKLIESCNELNLNFHEKGCVVTIEGPRFATRAESKMFRLLGGDVVNMSIAPEAILAKEAGIEYAVIAMSTDYDCWKQDENPVTWEEIERIFHENSSNVLNLILNVIKKIGNSQEQSKVVNRFEEVNEKIWDNKINIGERFMENKDNNKIEEQKNIGNLKEYQELCKLTAKKFETPEKEILTWGLGIAGEAGDVASCIKKTFAHDNDQRLGIYAIFLIGICRNF